MKPFTSSQKQFINTGKILNDQLAEKVLQALGKSDLVHLPKRHHYIVSTPGTGKTFTVQAAIDSHKLEVVRIQGVASMSAIAISLACAAYLSKGAEINVWIDDCDSIFLDMASLSVMKGVLDEDRNVLSWNKNMTTQIQVYEKSDSAADVLKAEAMRAYQPIGSVGLSVPTDNMRFIITSNRFLTPPNSNLNTRRKMDEAAIRDRVVYSEYNLARDESWGWVASILLSSKILKLKLEQKHILLDWMYTNWEQLPATSLRAVKELAADMLNYPDSYPDHWQSKLSSR